MNEQQICFINQSSPSEKIVVCDIASAATLSRILQKAAVQNWAIQREESAELPIVSALQEERRTKELRVILISGTHTFRCTTCDATLGGVRLKNAVPANFSEKQCMAYISHDDMRENIEITCQVITDQNGTSRLQFVKPNKPDMKKLSEWMTVEQTA